MLTKDFSYADEFWQVRGGNDVSSRVIKMIRPITSHRGVHDIRAKIQALFIGACRLAALSLCESFADIQQEKVFSKSISRKKLKNIPEIGVE